MLKKIGLLLLLALVVIQFFRPEQTNPEASASSDFLAVSQAPAPIGKILRQSCYDCHSHETTWPWYAQVAPVSWMVSNHVKDGRKHLNFSTWGEYPAKKQDHKLEECAEEVHKAAMPMVNYTWLHSDAKLSAEQRKQLVNWFERYRQQLQQPGAL